MPNWAISEMSVVLPTENIQKFQDLFLTGNGDKDTEKDRYFARCFMHSCDIESNEHGISQLRIRFDAAWSIYSCMISGYPEESNGVCPTLESVCKELNVKRLIAYSEEPGVGFEESINYTRKNVLTSESRELYPEPFYDNFDEDETLFDDEEVMG